MDDRSDSSCPGVYLEISDESLDANGGIDHSEVIESVGGVRVGRDSSAGGVRRRESNVIGVAQFSSLGHRTVLSSTSARVSNTSLGLRETGSSAAGRRNYEESFDLVVNNRLQRVGRVPSDERISADSRLQRVGRVPSDERIASADSHRQRVGRVPSDERLASADNQVMGDEMVEVRQALDDLHLPLSVPSDTVGRVGLRKIAKLWRFLTKRHHSSSPKMSRCSQSEEDRLSVTDSSCLCGGLRRSAGDQLPLQRQERVSVSPGDTLPRDRRDPEMTLPVTSSSHVTAHTAHVIGTHTAVHGMCAEERSMLVRLEDTAGNLTPRQGAYRNLCCGTVGSRSASSSSSNSLTSFTVETALDNVHFVSTESRPGSQLFNDDTHAQRGRLVSTTFFSPDSDSPLVGCHEEASSSSSLASSSVPNIVPRLAPTIHTQIDYVHCLVPELARIAACVYYWGVMDRYEAERLLEGRPEGTFLLRDSAQEEFLFSVSFRRYGRSLHARVEQWNHRFSFDSHDPSVFSSPSVRQLIEHYKDPASCMFFEPLLTAPLPRSFPFSLQALCRTAVCESTSYDGITALPVPKSLQSYLQYYHYKQKVRVRRFEAPLPPPPPAPPSRPLPPLPRSIQEHPV